VVVAPASSLPCAAVRTRKTIYALSDDALMRVVVAGSHHNVTAFSIQFDRHSVDPISADRIESLAHHHGVDVVELSSELDG
jgi:hypothetical protein